MTHYHEYDRPASRPPFPDNSNQPHNHDKSSRRGLLYAFLAIIAIIGGIAAFSGAGQNSTELLRQSTAILNSSPHQ